MNRLECDPHYDQQPYDECRLCACDLDDSGNCPGCTHREEFHPDEEPGWLCDDWANDACVDSLHYDEEEYDDAAE